MSRNDLSEIDLRVADKRIRLRRGQPVEVTSFPQALPAAVPQASRTPAAPTTAAEPPPKAAAKNLKEIKSPLVGTFYSAPKPGADPFVKVGAKVTPSTIVGLIEAMKLFNEIPAECVGT